MNLSLRSQGADLLPKGGVRYRTWAPGKEVAVVVSSAAGTAVREVSLGEEPGGYRSAIDPEGRVGDRYKYRFYGNEWPDPASRFNQRACTGRPRDRSTRLYWADGSWSRPASELSSTMHDGTFPPAALFAARSRSGSSRSARVNATRSSGGGLPGERNWGLKGVALCAGAGYARLTICERDRPAHGRGMAVILAWFTPRGRTGII